MDLIVESVEDSIRRAVPQNQNVLNKAREIADYLVYELGMESVDQLEHLQDYDLTGILSIFNARILIKGIQGNHLYLSLCKIY